MFTLYIEKNNSYQLDTSFSKKFANDKFSYENDEVLLILDGMILNKCSIQNKYTDCTTWEEVVSLLYKEHGETFFNVFDGSFSGVIHDKIKNTWIIYNDHIGSKPVYYTRIGKEYYLSSSIEEIYRFFKHHNISYSLNIAAAYEMLAYSYLLEDHTLCNEIQKLNPGSYMKIQNEKTEIHTYFTLDNTPDNTHTEDEWIRIIDETFREAVRSEFDKDREYGYKHAVTLSGGLDSRMVSWVAHDMGYTDQLNMTISQNNWFDETIPKKIAADLYHEWIFKSLNNGLFMFDIDEATLISEGQISYIGIAHLNSILKYLNWDTLGMLHTGVLGDVILGTYNETDKIQPPNDKQIAPLAFSCIANKLNPIQKQYPNQELLIFRQRGFNFILTGLRTMQKYTETMSPFYNKAFLQVCFKIPVNLRFEHRFYKKWIITKYPLATDYIWEKIQSKITKSPIPITYKGKKFYPAQLPGLIKNRISKSIKGTTYAPVTTGMNPFDYYLNNNKELAMFFETYFKQNIDLIKDKELKTDVESVFGNKLCYAPDKSKVLSLLSAIKVFEL